MPPKPPAQNGSLCDRVEQHGVEQDLPPCLGLPADDREHRHPDLFVLALHQQRQRPEVGRGPEEHDEEQQQRGAAHRPGHGGPRDQRGDGAGGAPDHDVLRVRRFNQTV